jgi:PIN domain nuclease of toxin-antitoxin system
VILLDTYALVAIAVDEPAAGEVEELLREGDCAVTTVNLAELVDQLVRRVGVDADAVNERVEALLDEPIVLRDLDRERAARAGLLRARHYQPKTAEFSLADCISLASLDEGDRLATAGPPLARVARELGFEVIALADSRGRRP